MIRSVVRGYGAALPKRVVANRELEGIVETSDEWIVQRTGIRQRYIAGEGETTASLGEAAARRLPLKWIRLAAALGFAATGLWVLLTG